VIVSQRRFYFYKEYAMQEPSESDVTVVSTKKQPQFQCICCWDDCVGIYSALKKKLPDDDPWTEPPILFYKRRTSLKYQCLKYSIFHHFGIKGEVAAEILNQSLFVVSRHHWPRELLRLSAKGGNISDLVFRHTLKTIDSTEGYSRLLEECNKYHFIIKKLGSKLKRFADPRQKGKLLSIGNIVADVYVRAPVVDHSSARLEAFGTRRKKTNNFEYILPPHFNIDDKEESVSVTSPLDTAIHDNFLDDSSTVDMLQEDDTEFIVQGKYDERDVQAVFALTSMRRNSDAIPFVDAIIPSVAKLRETLVAAFSSVHSPDWHLDQISRDALWLLKTRYEIFEPIPVAQRIYLYPCDYTEGANTNCLTYSLRTIAMKISIPCDYCKDQKYGNQRRLSRHSSEEWTNRIQDPTTKMRLSYLTPLELKERYSALKRTARATKQKLSIVEKKLTSHLDEITLDDSDKKMKEVLRKAMTYIQNNESSCQKAILQALMDIEQKRPDVCNDGRNDSKN
jgi:hypothetical protein